MGPEKTAARAGNLRLRLACYSPVSPGKFTFEEVKHRHGATIRISWLQPFRGVSCSPREPYSGLYEDSQINPDLIPVTRSAHYLLPEDLGARTLMAEHQRRLLGNSSLATVPDLADPTRAGIS